MNKLLFLAVVGLCCILSAKCEDKFYEEWKEYMDSSYCKTDDEETRGKYLECCKKFPQDVHHVIKEVTEKDELKEQMDALCKDDVTIKKMCERMEKEMSGGNHLGMTEEVKKDLDECKSS